MDDDKKRLRHIMQLWLCCTDPEQRAELGKQAAELQAQMNGKKKPDTAEEQRGRSDSENTTNQGGAVDEL